MRENGIAVEIAIRIIPITVYFPVSIVMSIIKAKWMTSTRER
jgi:hypothetical protein